VPGSQPTLVSDTSVRIDDTTLEAFRHLCELVHRPTRRRLDAALAQDWSAFPPIAAAVAGDPSPTLAGTRVRALLERAHAALAAAHPSTDEVLSGLEVVRIHLIEGHSWDAITAERMEAGHPVSARTLRTRQREGLRAILEWAADGAPEAADAVPDQRPAPGHRARQRLLVGAALVTVSLVVMLILWPPPPSPADELAPHHVGRMIDLDDGAHVLPPPFPPVELPYPEARLVRVMVVPDGDDRFALVLTTRPSDRDPPFTALWDPVDRTERWRYRLEIDPEEVRTHATLPDSVHAFAFWPGHLYYGSWASNLGDRIALNHFQANSPCVTTILRLADGVEVGRYVHPGRLEYGRVLDLDADGGPELLLGGPDNALNRPVLVVLDPTDVQGAASTVQWNGAGEGAAARVLLPDVPAFRGALDAPRLHVGPFHETDWDPARGVLTLKVIASVDRRVVNAYQMPLGRDLRPVPEAGVVFGDGERREWRKLGLTPPPDSVLFDDIEILGAWPETDDED